MLKMVISLQYIYIQAGVTALHLASSNGRVAVVRLLIQAYAVINLQSEVKNFL